jgi:hypothetical protein
MFQHVCVIIRELFRACWFTCESNTIVDKILRYTLLRVCCVEAWCAPIGALGNVNRNIGIYQAST